MKKISKPTQKLLMNISNHKPSHDSDSTIVSPKNMLNKFSIPTKNPSKSLSSTLSPRIQEHHYDMSTMNSSSKSPRTIEKSPSVYFLKESVGSSIDKENNRNITNISVQSSDLRTSSKNKFTSPNLVKNQNSNINHKQRDSILIVAEQLKPTISPYFDPSRRPGSKHILQMPLDSLKTKTGGCHTRNTSYVKINQLAPTLSMSSLKRSDSFDNDEILLSGMKNHNNIQSTTKLLSLAQITSNEKNLGFEKRRSHEKTPSLKIDLSLHGTLCVNNNNSKNDKNSSELIENGNKNESIDRSSEVSIRIDNISARSSCSNLNPQLSCIGIISNNNSNELDSDENRIICNKPKQITQDDDKKCLNLGFVDLKEGIDSHHRVISEDGNGFKLTENLIDHNQNPCSEPSYSVRVSICQPDETEKRNETEHRRQEISNFIKKIGESVKDMGIIEESIMKERNKTQIDYKNALEDLEDLTKRLTSIIKDQKESHIISWNLEYGKELLRFQEYERQLMGFNKDVEEMKGDIEEHLDNIIHNIDHKPYHIIMEKYQDRLNNFTKFSVGFNSASSYRSLSNFAGLLNSNDNKKNENLLGSNSKNHYDSKFLDKINEYRQKIKIILQEILDNPRYECFKPPSISDIHTNIRIKTIVQDDLHVNNHQLLNNMRKFEDFLKSEEDEINIKMSPRMKSNNIMHHNKQNPVFVSFENKEIFENALKDSAERMSVFSTAQSPNCKTLLAGGFCLDSEESILNNILTERLISKDRTKQQTEGYFGSQQKESNALLGKNKDYFNESNDKKFKIYNEAMIQDNVIKIRNDPSPRDKSSSENDYLNFVNYLNNKLKEEALMSNKSNIQKSLLWSPNFKDNREDIENDK